MSIWPIQAGTQIRKNRIGFLLVHVSKDAIAFFLHLKQVLTWTESLAFRVVGVPGDSVIGVTCWPCAHCGWLSPQHMGPQAGGTPGVPGALLSTAARNRANSRSARLLCAQHIPSFLPTRRTRPRVKDTVTKHPKPAKGSIQ